MSSLNKKFPRLLPEPIRKGMKVAELIDTAFKAYNGGRLAEALGREKDALAEYKAAARSADRTAAMEARLLDIALRQKRDEIGQEDALRDLETRSIQGCLSREKGARQPFPLRVQPLPCCESVQ